MTDSDQTDYQPLDSSVVPRDADVATFMRLPRVADLEHVDIGVFGAPLDGASFRGGTRLGPSAVREASRGIRRVHPTTLVSPFDLANVADVGDAPVNMLAYASSLETVAAFVAGLRARGVVPLGVGGDHSATLAILRGFPANELPLGVLQFDAHADVQNEFFGTRDNHASVMRRATEEGIINPSRVVQLGLRGTRFGDQDVQFGIDAGFTAITYDEYEAMGRAAAIARINDVLGDGPVYISYDVDGLDPTEAPGTPAREPGGLSMRDSQVILRSLRGLDAIGADVCEVAPTLDPSGLTATNAANLLFELVCLLAESFRARTAEQATA